MTKIENSLRKGNKKKIHIGGGEKKILDTLHVIM
jgi:hypothetical protein